MLERIIENQFWLAKRTALILAAVVGIIAVTADLPNKHSICGAQHAYAEDSTENSSDLYENIAKRMEELNARKQYDAAIELGKDYVNQQNNKNFFFYNELGVAYLMNTHYADAIQFFKKSLALNSSFIDTHANLGVAYTKIGDYQNALVEFKKVKMLNPTHPSADKWIQFINKKL